MIILENKDLTQKLSFHQCSVFIYRSSEDGDEVTVRYRRSEIYSMNIPWDSKNYINPSRPPSAQCTDL
jgi:hypothetical protein